MMHSILWQAASVGDLLSIIIGHLQNRSIAIVCLDFTQNARDAKCIQLRTNICAMEISNRS